MSGISGLGRNCNKGGNTSQELYLQLAIQRLVDAVKGRDTESSESNESIISKLNEIIEMLDPSKTEKKASLKIISVDNNTEESTIMISKSVSGSVANLGNTSIQIGETTLPNGTTLSWGEDEKEFGDIVITCPASSKVFISYTILE